MNEISIKFMSRPVSSFVTFFLKCSEAVCDRGNV